MEKLRCLGLHYPHAELDILEGIGQAARVGCTLAQVINQLASYDKCPLPQHVENKKYTKTFLLDRLCEIDILSKNLRNSEPNSDLMFRLVRFELACDANCDAWKRLLLEEITYALKHDQRTAPNIVR
jgi:hypothetical protein